MDIAVISLTEKGRQLSAQIARSCREHRISRFCFYKHTDSEAVLFTDLSSLTGKLFAESDSLVFVCACGIAVRMTAPYLRSKQTDPAVIVIDDCGRYVIPILSGHIGGANVLAMQLAELLGAQAAITTATDTGGHFSPDSFAAANSLIITDLKAAKEIAAAVLEGERIGFRSDYEFRGMPPELTCEGSCRTGISISAAPSVQPFPVTLNLIPRNMVLGIGCRRGTATETIKAAVSEALAEADIQPERVCAAATIDLKADEPGITEYCRSMRIPLVTYSAGELMETPGEFTPSSFVRSVTGADNVCERSAVRLSGGTLVLRKRAWNGVTAAVAEKPLLIDFERKQL